MENSRLTIINANNSFAPYFEKGDEFIKSEIEKKGINVEYGLRLVEVKNVTMIFILGKQYCHL